MATQTHSYATAAVPDPYRILGLRLKPFALGHYLLLQRFGCAFIQEEIGTASVEDLILGVLVCSMTHREFLEFLEQKNFLKQTQAWGKKLGLIDFQEKALLFQQYLKQGLHEPDYVALKPQNTGGGDWAQNLKITLMTQLNYTENQALELPLSQALADYYKLAESEGLILMLTKEDLAAADANAAALESLSSHQPSTTRCARATARRVNHQPGGGDKCPA